MDSKSTDTSLLRLRERFLKTWLAPAAVVGGVVSLVIAAFRARPVPSAPAPAAGKPAGTLLQMAAPPAAAALDWEYAPSGMVGGTAAKPPFQTSFVGMAVDASGQVFGLGDGEVRVFGTDGRLQRHWTVAPTAQSLGVGPDGRIYVAGAGRVDVFGSDGQPVGGFAVGEARSPASLTAIHVTAQDILVGDASARIVWRLDPNGRTIGRIGDQNKTKAFILPNGRLDLAVDAHGTVVATDSGRHQVTSWALDGTPAGAFGKFGMTDPADFVGCCNPVSVAVTPGGQIVTAEKVTARVKIFEPGGRLLALIGPEHFDRMCTQIHLAVDAQGRIIAGDPVRRTITVFARVTKKGTAA